MDEARQVLILNVELNAAEKSRKDVPGDRRNNEALGTYFCSQCWERFIVFEKIEPRKIYSLLNDTGDL